MLTRRFPVAAALPAYAACGDVDRVIGNFLSAFNGVDLPSATFAKAIPALNIWQDEQNIFIEAEIPGFRMDQVDISLTGRDLTIQATRETEAETEGKSWVRRERTSGQFSRSVRLPVPVDAQGVTAKLTDGVLTITLPVAPEAKPHKITVS